MRMRIGPPGHETEVVTFERRTWILSSKGTKLLLYTKNCSHSKMRP